MRWAKPIKRVAIVTQSRNQAVAGAVSRLERLAASKGIQLTGEEIGRASCRERV